MLLYLLLYCIQLAGLFMSMPISMPMSEQEQPPPSAPFALRVAVDHDIGIISGEYNCVYSQVNGTLYAGSTALYFLGTFFLFDKKLRLPWENVRRVQKANQGLQVLTKDNVVYSFTGIHSLERAWVVMVSLHNDALLDRPPSRSHSSPYTERGYKRRNSDPLLSSNADFDMYIRDDNEKGDGSGSGIISASASASTLSRVDGIKTSGRTSKSTAPIPPPSSPIPPPPYLPPSNVFSSSGAPDVAEIENLIGKLSLDPIRSTHDGVAGNLYAGSDALYFYGRKFFWDKRVVLKQWSVVRQVQVIEQTLLILDKEGNMVEFQEIKAPDKVWASLVSLHNDNLVSPSRPLRESENRRSTLRRMNSDPIMSPFFSLWTSTDVEEEEEDAATEPTTTDGEGGASQHGSQQETTPVLTLHEEWTQAKQASEYDKMVVQDHVLKCNLDTYVDMFLRDGANYSIAKFLEERGDSNLTESQWKDGAELSTSRVIHYTHPVNAPLAPPEAGARKEQSYRRYGDCGLCIETKTHVDDVPLADCFYVADRVLVEPNQGDDSVSVTMEFSITFVKTTMFKSIISKTTASEFVVFFQSMADYMTRSLGDGAAVQHAEPVVRVVEQPKRSLESPWSNIMVPLLVLVLMFQVWIMLEVRGVKSTLRLLQNSIVNGDNQCGLKAGD
jgi:hypothetical protein